MISGIEPCLNAEMLATLQQSVDAIHVSDALIDYTQALVEHTRRSPDYQTGLSPRAALALLAAARAWALLEKRNHVLPEDIQTILPAVAPHRLRFAEDRLQRLNAAQIAERLIEAVPSP